MTKAFIISNWVLLVVSTIGMIVCLWLWAQDSISDRAMLGITLALSWAAVIYSAVGSLITAYVKRDVEP